MRKKRWQFRNGPTRFMDLNNWSLLLNLWKQTSLRTMFRTWSGSGTVINCFIKLFIAVLFYSNSNGECWMHWWSQSWCRRVILFWSTKLYWNSPITKLNAITSALSLDLLSYAFRFQPNIQFAFHWRHPISGASPSGAAPSSSVCSVGYSTTADRTGLMLN